VLQNLHRLRAMLISLDRFLWFAVRDEGRKPSLNRAHEAHTEWG
jgi:hypothetical protein